MSNLRQQVKDVDRNIFVPAVIESVVSYYTDWANPNPIIRQYFLYCLYRIAFVGLSCELVAFALVQKRSPFYWCPPFRGTVLSLKIGHKSPGDRLPYPSSPYIGLQAGTAPHCWKRYFINKIVVLRVVSSSNVEQHFFKSITVDLGVNINVKVVFYINFYFTNFKWDVFGMCK